MDPRSRALLRALLVAGALAGCGPGASSSSSTPSVPSGVPSPTAAVFEADVDVGFGRTIHIECAGPTDAGRPTIVFENGSGPPLSTWRAVMTEITTTDRACAYDRAGIGRSEAAPESRTTRDQVADLVDVLQTAGLTGPIVLVAHSLGGWNAIVYTAENPDQVVGAVLVDVLPPGLEARWLAELPPETPDEPADLHEARDTFTSFLEDPTANAENLRIADSTEQVLAAPGFGDRPIEILWATKSQVTVWPPSFGPDLAARLNAAYAEAQGDVEALAQNPTVTPVDTDHSIHEERPQVVIDAIRRVLAALET